MFKGFARTGRNCWNSCSNSSASFVYRSLLPKPVLGFLETGIEHRSAVLVHIACGFGPHRRTLPFRSRSARSLVDICLTLSSTVAIRNAQSMLFSSWSLPICGSVVRTAARSWSTPTSLKQPRHHRVLDGFVGARRIYLSTLPRRMLPVRVNHT